MGALPQENSTKEERTLGSLEAADRLRTIWFAYALSGGTPEALDSRRKDIQVLNEQLSPKAADYLAETVLSDDNKAIVTRGQQIQMEALKAGTAQLRKDQQAKRTSAGLSKGQRLAIRRQKAHERRGTRPDLIH